MFCWFCFKKGRPGESQDEARPRRGAASPVAEVPGERTNRRGVWLITPLDVKKMGLLVGKTPGGSLPCSWCWLIFEERSLRLDWRYR